MSTGYRLPVSIDAPLILTLFVALCWSLSAAGQTENFAAIATPEENATRVAREVLEAGGNAVDAAVATAFVLAVTQPEAGNIGGGGFMTMFMDGESFFLDYRETAPALAKGDMYLRADGQIDVEASLTGHRSVGTPGTVAGLWEAHERFGRLAWPSLIAPAVQLAAEGFIADPLLEDYVQAELPRLKDTNFGDYFGSLRAGLPVIQSELASTLQLIAEEGRDGFYEGSVGRLIIEEMERGGGLISAGDLSSYTPRWRTPLRGAWRDLSLVTAPLPSSGGMAILQFLGMREILDEEFAGLTHNSVQYIHLKSEIEKRIFADRARYLGDPDYVDFRVERLVDGHYLVARARAVDTQRPSPTAAVTAGLEGKHTTHFSIVDGEGNAVANTYTLNMDFGAGVVVSGAGFLLNSEMDDFSAAPGQPNYYGVVGDEANAIEPGKRMLSSMAPTLVLRDNKVAMVLGAMGGSAIFTTVYQTIMNVVDFEMSAREAQSVPRVHHQLLPENLITYSPATPLPAATQRGLRERGYVVQPHDWEFGNVQLIVIDEAGNMQAASDPRFSGRASVFPIPAAASTTGSLEVPETSP